MADELQAWVGRSESAEDTIDRLRLAGFAATLDRPLDELAPGGALPPLWHWMFFQTWVPQSGLGPDGHPKRGGFLPPVHHLPRRMWAGGRVSFRGPLFAGEPMTRKSTIVAIREKTGSTGALVFVTVRHVVSGPRGVAIEEEQDIVYRGLEGAAVKQAGTPPPPPEGAFTETVTPDPVMLFRYSALTFNGHRIHYDHPYVTGVEGYPNLVMNGGLTTLLVYELARTHGSTPVKFMSSRNVRALFVNRTITVCGEPSADNRTAKLWAQDDSGALALTAEAEFA